MAVRKKLSQLQYEHLAALRHALRCFHRFSEDAAKRAGLTPQQHQALLAIKGFPKRSAVTISALAERLQLRHHSTVGLVDRLAGLTLVSRTQSAVDRRRVHIHLTKRGERILDRLSSAHQEELRRIGPELSKLLHRLGAAPNDTRPSRDAGAGQQRSGQEQSFPGKKRKSAKAPP